MIALLLAAVTITSDPPRMQLGDKVVLIPWVIHREHIAHAGLARLGQQHGLAAVMQHQQTLLAIVQVRFPPAAAIRAPPDIAAERFINVSLIMVGAAPRAPRRRLRPG